MNVYFKQDGKIRQYRIGTEDHVQAIEMVKEDCAKKYPSKKMTILAVIQK